jgi:hypothetical protein
MAAKGKGTRSKAGAKSPKAPGGVEATRSRGGSSEKKAPASAELADPIPMVEVVCPACSSLFKAPEEAGKGACPFCRKNLRFAEVEEFVEEAVVSSANGHSVPTDCPVCGTSFKVAPTATQATCPGCDTELKLSDEPPSAIGVVECPKCSKTFETPLDENEGTCPHCGVEMEFEDVKGPSRARAR